MIHGVVQVTWSVLQSNAFALYRSNAIDHPELGTGRKCISSHPKPSLALSACDRFTISRAGGRLFAHTLARLRSKRPAAHALTPVKNAPNPSGSGSERKNVSMSSSAIQLAAAARQSVFVFVFLVFFELFFFSSIRDPPVLSVRVSSLTSRRLSAATALTLSLAAQPS